MLVQTSLIPTVIALSGFFAQNFPDISWYPYWYLGNPYHYLIGPVVPILLTVISKIFPFTLFQIYLGLIFTSLIFGALGIFLLLKDFKVKRSQAIVSGIFYIIFPTGIFLLSYQNGLTHLTLALLPYIILLYKRFLEEKKILRSIFLILSTTSALLIDVSILLPLTVAFIALFFSLKIEKGQKEEKIVKTILILLSIIFLSSIWYTFGFWWTILTNPSVGGIAFGNLIVSLTSYLINLLPLVFAILVTKWRKSKLDSYLNFILLFSSSFLFLTLIRFVSDPDFIIDWIGFSLELQFGVSIILGYIFSLFFKKSQKYARLCLFTTIVFFAVFSSLALKNLFLNKDQAYIHKTKNLLLGVKVNERVFLSGSEVFFTNSQKEISQVRGGVDQASIHPFWAHAAFQIREGRSKEATRNWLASLGITYILIHEKDSKEKFHDFKVPEKFYDLKLLKGDNADKLYQAEGFGIARISNIEILNVERPKNGEDWQTLTAYSSSLKRSLPFSFIKPNEIYIENDIKKDEAISLAISYHPSWEIMKGNGKITKDSLGNIVIIPDKEGNQSFILASKRKPLDIIMPVFLFFSSISTILFFRVINPYILRILSSPSLGFLENDEDY